MPLSEDKIGQGWTTGTKRECLLQISKSAKELQVEQILEPEIIICWKFCEKARVFEAQPFIA